MSQQAPIIIDIDDVDRRGLYESFSTQKKSKTTVGARDCGYKAKFRFARKSQTTTRPWDDVNTDGATIEIGIGEPDKAPTAGTFWLGYGAATSGTVANGKRFQIQTFIAGDDFTNIGAASNASGVIFNATGTTPTTWTNGSTVIEISQDMAYNVSAADMTIFLNGMTSIALAGQVLVTALTNAYEVAFLNNGARTTLYADGTLLFPESTVTTNDDRVGSSTAMAVKLVTITRNPYAYTNAFVATNPGGATMSVLQVGSTAQKSIQRLTFTDLVEPYDGTLTLNWGKPQVTIIACHGDNPGVQTVGITIPVTTVATDLASLSIVIFTGANVAHQFWFKVSGTGTAPAAPSGGSNHEVDIATGADATAIAAALGAIITGVTGFTAVYAGNAMTVINSAVGSASAAVDNGTGFVLVTTPSTGGLDLKTFILYDENGSVGVWGTSTGATVAPAAAAACARQIKYTFSASAVASAIATAIATAVDADSEFVAATYHTTSVKVTDAVGGERTPAADSDSGMTLTTQTGGVTVTVNCDYNASASVIQTDFGNAFTVRRSQNGTITFVAIIPGVMPDISVDDSDLTFPNINEATMNLATVAMWKRSTQDSANPMKLTIQGRVTFSGDLPVLFYEDDINVYRSIFQGTPLVPSPLFPTEYTTPPSDFDSPGVAGQYANDGSYFWSCFSTGTVSGTPRWLKITGVTS